MEQKVPMQIVRREDGPQAEAGVVGLSSQEAEQRLRQFGANDVAADKKDIIKKYLRPLYSPISLMLLAAAGLSWAGHRVFDQYFILAMYLLNYTVQKWQEHKADKAIEELQKKLSFDVWTLRDKKWEFVNAKQLVPGDVIRLGLGSMIPADAKVISGQNLSVNEAVLTGESLPKNKKTGDTVYSGAFIATGTLEAEIAATGKNTYFGKTIFSIEGAGQKSILEKDVLAITRFLTGVSIAAVAVLTAVFLFRGYSITELLTLDLSLVIAGIPIALPAVMAMILSIGASGLAKKEVVVRRLSALQDLANVNLLLTDKTGTLTKNEIRVAEVISYQKGAPPSRVVELASFASRANTPDAIDQAVLAKWKETASAGSAPFQTVAFTPFDSNRKRSTMTVRRDKKTLLVSVGAPQAVADLCRFGSAKAKERFNRDIARASDEGFRALAVAWKTGSDAKETDMHLAGLLLLADPLDESSKDTLEFMSSQGIGVKMLTGDNQVIAARVARDLGLPGKTLNREETRTLYGAAPERGSGADVSVFAQVMPEDKYHLVRFFKHHFVVASTGDGINDLPALKTANVGIAVSNAVSALKSLADIVLLGRGLSVIKDAIIESRKIFQRLYNYSVYRISESFRLIVTILLLGLLYGSYPLMPLQIILLAFLNDIPIISLATDRVGLSAKPSQINAKSRLVLSLLFGAAGIANSMLLFLLARYAMHLPLAAAQTMFFLKLTVSGHMLIFVAHTKKRWYRFLPSWQVIAATVATQVFATALALTGWLMPMSLSLPEVAFVWLWAFLWMQVTELAKVLATRVSAD